MRPVHLDQHFFLRNFNPRTPCGVRRRRLRRLRGCGHFNPRTPCGVRPGSFFVCGWFNPFQSTHPLRGATQNFRDYLLGYIISIHAPLAGCDPKTVPKFADSWYFNPRTPCGVRHGYFSRFSPTLAFQSTHPLRGATSPSSSYSLISIFQSTHPLRGATPTIYSLDMDYFISIHAPLAGCDPRHSDGYAEARHFNPRTPCGVRRTGATIMSGCTSFQSTHPLRGATKNPSACAHRRAISIHAPLAGCDGKVRRGLFTGSDFNPRTPCGVRPRSSTSLNKRLCISIHAPLAGCDGE